MTCKKRDVPLDAIKFQKGETCDAKYVSYDELKQMIANEEVIPPLFPYLSQFIDEFERLLLG